MSEKTNTGKNSWGHRWTEDRHIREVGSRKLAKIMTGDRVWIPVAILFLFLCILTWVNEIFHLYHHIFGITKHIPINLDEALSETFIIAVVGIITISILIRNIHKRRAVEKELKDHHRYLEDMVAKRTSTLEQMVDAMAGRVVKMSELQMAVQSLRIQIKQAGLVPATDIPIIAESNPTEESQYAN